MISFIVIGKNEGWKLTKCFEGIFRAIEYNNLKDCEVIYVDSQSTDDSIERARAFNRVKIFQLGNVCNAAIARNVGVEESSGEVLFFIDGDMEIIPEFLSIVYNKVEGLIYPFISGQLKNYNYDKDNILISNTWQYKEVLKGDKYYSTTGGIFLIERKLWIEIGGMDNRFKRGQDLDLGLSIAEKGIKLLRKKDIIANHYTIAHTHHSRMWKVIFSGDIAYSNSFLLRKHILNSSVYKNIFKSYYTLVSLLLFSILAMLFGHYYLIIGYLIIIIIKTYKFKSNSFIRNIELFGYFILRDLSFVYYLFIPLRKIHKSEIKYSIIK